MEVLDCIANGGEVLLERLLGNDDGAPAVIGVEGERWGILQTAVEKKDDMTFRVVD